ncbi:MAG: DUF3574 domain-containing protein [Candidatus Electrothrix sp. AR3]|nr:DUF3574 domain-containing protein [Candidatus Electrothrix sp. AR3]
MKILVKILSVAASSLLFACASPQDGRFSASSCPAGGIIMSKVELYFGLDIPNGGRVEPAAWQMFIDQEVTPRFPEGLTIDKVSGQWQDAKTGRTVQEPSRVLMILYKPSAKTAQAIEDIRAAYKSKFRQDSVMRLDETNCVSF